PYDVVALVQNHPAHAVSRTYHGANVAFVEPDSLTVVRSEEDDLAAIRQRGAHQLVLLLNADRNNSARHHVGEVLQLRLLHRSIARGEEDVAAFFFQVTNRKHRADRLSGLQRNQVPDMLALAGSPDIGDLVHLEPVHAPRVSEDQNVSMRGGDEQMLDEVLVARLHAGAARAPAPLIAVGGDRRPLQIPRVADRNRNLFVSNQVFQLDFGGFVLNHRAAFVTVLLLDFFQFLDDDATQLLLGPEN